MARILDGRPVAAALQEEVQERASRLAARGVVPGLAIVRVGEDPASVSYARQKDRAAAGLGLRSHVFVLPGEVGEGELLSLIGRLNGDPGVHGVLVQLPLPPERILAAVDPRKDADGLHPENLGRLVRGDPHLLPCSPRAVQEILVRSGYHPAGKHVVIVGRGLLVGRSLSILLSHKGPGGMPRSPCATPRPPTSAASPERRTLSSLPWGDRGPSRRTWSERERW